MVAYTLTNQGVLIFLLLFYLYYHESQAKDNNDCPRWRVQLLERNVGKSQASLWDTAKRLAVDIQSKSFGQIGKLDGYFYFDIATNNLTAIEHFLNNHEHIKWHKQDKYLVRTKRNYQAEYFKFSDPLFPKQWHLKNWRRAGIDCNVTGVWSYNVTGRGVVVAIIDDGVEWRHPDLVDNYFPEGSFDLNGDDNDPTPKYDEEENNKHGTRCAGEIAAVPNSVCGIGIAYESKFSGIRVLDGPTTDSKEAVAFNKHMDVNDIYSCSWGPEDDGKTVDGPHEMGQLALAHGVVAGRRGFGSIFVVASGNGGEKDDNCNYDGYTNSIYTITVGAVDENGNKPSYAEECLSMLACTVSSGTLYSRSIVTTDWSLGKGNSRDQCTESHTGTSAATPLAAGMIALMLQVNPCLTWRDIQHIIVMTANKIDAERGWTYNQAGFHHSNAHGFGLLDAWKLVNAAKVWQPVPWLTSLSADTRKDKNLVIPLNEALTVRSNVSHQDCEDHLLASLEYVTFTVSITHKHRGKLRFMFECPSGTQSIIPRRKNDVSEDGLEDWQFTTAKCWGETPYGIYKLRIFDGYKTRNLKDSVLKSWKLTIYGSKWSQSDVKRRRSYVQSSYVQNILSNQDYAAVKCPPLEVLKFDITTTLSHRTIKLVSMLSCFFVFWAIYYSLEMTFCNDEADEKNPTTSTEDAMAVTDHTTYNSTFVGIDTEVSQLNETINGT